ncbi:MAG: cyclic nucleotide-binding domain-containing protein [Desulfobacterales bacterium]|jgi:CRP-like cAMP-binding protein|nr:cyclic nucleotide-binding domain-containing protein [Deltaproteobacteria bacterium]
MYLKQSDLFTGLGHNFLKQTMAIAEKVSFEKGAAVLKKGEPADYFFILIEGQVSLLTGDSGKIVYQISGRGEIFGCSSLIGRDSYFLTATCDEPSVALKIDRSKMEKILTADADNERLFFKQLSRAIGDRMMTLYARLP